MSSSSKTKLVREVIAATLFAATLAGCSDIYYDRRETIALGADDAVAGNKAIQMIDPWPRYSANRNLAFNGERMQRAIECYQRSGVTPPVSPATTQDPSSASSSSKTEFFTKCPPLKPSDPATTGPQINIQAGNTTTNVSKP